MMADPYNARVRELFTATEHAGTVSDGTEVICDEQGIRLTLSGSTANGAVNQLRYRVVACPHVIACCEQICSELEGQSLTSLEEFSTGVLMQSLAVPAPKSGRIIALEDTVRQLGAALRESSSSKEQD